MVHVLLFSEEKKRSFQRSHNFRKFSFKKEQVQVTLNKTPNEVQKYGTNQKAIKFFVILADQNKKADGENDLCALMLFFKIRNFRFIMPVTRYRYGQIKITKTT
jgi:hypothetical protein